ncbi:unnamed protein product [Linum trigynum]|uniref:Uncharacterized protein n=1 Tax=Linum trigynum TaxID=586398 RepID=A0AAV2FYS2_9ROSI
MGGRGDGNDKTGKANKVHDSDSDDAPSTDSNESHNVARESPDRVDMESQEVDIPTDHTTGQDTSSLDIHFQPSQLANVASPSASLTLAKANTIQAPPRKLGFGSFVTTHLMPPDEHTTNGVPTSTLFTSNHDAFSSSSTPLVSTPVIGIEDFNEDLEETFNVEDQARVLQERMSEDEHTVKEAAEKEAPIIPPTSHTHTSSSDHASSPVDLGMATLDENLEYLKDLETQFLVSTSSTISNPPTSSIKSALTAVGEFLALLPDGVMGDLDAYWPHEALNLLATLELYPPVQGVDMEQVLVMRSAASDIKSWLDTIEQARAIHEKLAHEEEAKATTHSSLQKELAKGKQTSSEVATFQAKEATRKARIAELKVELERLEEEEAQERAQKESLARNLNETTATIRALRQKIGSLMAVNEIALQRAKANFMDRESKTKLNKLKASFEEILKSLNA